MKLQVRYSTLSVLYYVMCMCLMTIYQVIAMRTMEHGVEPMRGTTLVACLVLFVLAGSLLKFWLIPGYKAYKPTLTMKLYLVYLCWVFVPIMMNDIDGDFMDQVNAIVKQALPIFSLLLTYNFLLNHRDSKLYSWYFCISSVLFAIQYFLIMRDLFPEIAHMVVSYYTLYMLPLIMLTCGNKRRTIFVIFTLLVLITSIKRGGIIAMGGGLFAYGFAYLVASPKVKAKSIIYALSVLAVLLSMFFYLASTMEAGSNNIIDRFERMETDEGSGRTVTWAKTYALIENSDFGDYIFGHGYKAVEHDSQMGWSAHNDFLEVWYDYGFIGLVLFTLAVVSLLTDVIANLLRKTPYAPVLCFFFASYFMLSMASHVIVYPWANVAMLTISYIAGRQKLDERVDNKKTTDAVNE